AGVHQVGGDVAQRVHEQVHVQPAHPAGEHVVRGLEIHRGDHGDQVAHLLRVQRRVAQRERATLAHAQQVDRAADGFDQVVHRTVDEAVDVVVEGEVAVGAVRVAPVQNVHVQAQLQQPAHQRAVGLQVDHVRAVD